MLLHLVRHGPPLVTPGLPAARWRLDPDRVSEVERLGTSGVLPAYGAPWFTSTEPKAAQTARLLHPAEPVTGLDGLREVARPAGWFDAAESIASVARSLERPEVPARAGWETAASVRARTWAAVQRDVVQRADRLGAGEVVLVGHGTAWTVLVAAITGQPPDLEAWRTMSMPDHCTLDLYAEDDEDGSEPSAARGRVVRPWGSWRSS